MNNGGSQILREYEQEFAKIRVVDLSFYIKRGACVVPLNETDEHPMVALLVSTEISSQESKGSPACR